MEGELETTEEEVSGYVERLSIGGTDAGAIMGLSRWKSNVDIWHRFYDLMQEVERIPQPDNDHTRGGRRMEPIIRGMYEERYGVQILLPDTIFCDRLGIPRHANLDGVIMPVNPLGTSNPGVFEAKYLGPNTFPATLSNGLAPDYYAQVQHYMSATNLGWAGYAILSKEGYEGENFDPDEHFHTLVVERDQGFIDAMELAEQTFWNGYVMNGLCPALLTDPMVECPKVGRLGEDWIDRSEFLELVRSREGVSTEMKLLEHQKKLLDEKIKAAMGDTQVVLLGKGKVSYKWGSSLTFPKESQAALQADFPEIRLQSYMKKNTSRSLRISGKLP